MLEAITRILDRCRFSDTVLPPTEVFNEGWMLRIILDWFDHNRTFSHPLAFAPCARWYSEALLPSRFLSQFRGDKRAENYTHADGIVGHFKIIPGERGDATLLHNAKQFVVIEAKIGSKLSSGTMNAPDFDQAARSVACIAHMLGITRLQPTALDRLAFYVLAPSAQIRAGLFADLATKESIERKVRERVNTYNGVFDAWFEDIFKPVLVRIDVAILSWEEVLATLPANKETEQMCEFYTQCLKFNPLRGKGAV